MHIVYRRLVNGDEGAYRRVHLESLKAFPGNFGTLHQDQVKVAKLPFETYIETGSTDNFIFGAFANENLVGIAGFRRGDRPKTLHRGEIVQVFVDPEFQGNGIARSLLGHVIEAALALNGIETLELSAVADNEPARRLYEEFGFETYGIRPNYFKFGDRYWDQRFMHLPASKYFDRPPKD
jgi:ribosomal protein S18 acetylase RimI-like enzyme